MTIFVETLNVWGDRFLGFAWPMLWQSSLLITIISALDLLLRRKLRAAIRHLLWLMVLVKLILPPSFASPMSVGWWVRSHHPIQKTASTKAFIVTYAERGPEFGPLPVDTAVPPPSPRLSGPAWALISSTLVSAVLLGWLLVRWRQITAQVSLGAPASETSNHLLSEATRLAGLRRSAPLRVTRQDMSPAVCGLFRPVVLLPKSLADHLPPAQLRAVLLHELIHLRRCDVWMNFAQALLQIAYWWHPLLWLANARIRRVREEAVDDAVMLALADKADTYAPTLLEVARLALNRPMAGLGLVGILESRNALRQRIERLVNFTTPGRAGLSVASVLAVASFSAIAVPMGEGPARLQELPISSQTGSSRTNLIFTGKGRQAIIHKLDHIRLDNVYYDNLPLNQVVLQISEETKQRDPENRGIRFLIRNVPTPEQMSNSSHGDEGKAEAATLVQDGRLLFELGKVDQARDRLQKALAIDAENKAARYYLDLIEKSDGKSGFQGPSHILALDSNPTNLYVRKFKVDAGAFLANVRERTSLATTSSREENQQALIKLFSGAGVNWQPSYSIFFDNLQGTLLLRAHSQDLDFVEAIVQVLNYRPPEVNIKVKFVALTEEAGRTLDIDWLLQNGMATNVNPNAGMPPSTATALGSGGTTNSPLTFTGTLTQPQYQVVLGALHKRGGVDLLSEMQVTTLSGRQAQIQAVDLMIIVTNINPQALKSSGVSSTSGAKALLQTQNVPIGSTVDLLPTAGRDNRTIEMTIIPSTVEFLGYEEPTNITAYVDGEKRSVSVPLPQLRVRQMASHVVLLDGQTVVLGNPPDVQANFPEQPGHEKKQLLVFVTATLVDSSGQRVNFDKGTPLQDDKLQARDLRVSRP
jgi:beta-lactamase regulating signal transducer with metallopeptidase domain